MATKQAVAEDAPRSFREIVQKKFLDEVIGATGNNNSISILKSHCLFFHRLQHYNIQLVGRC